MNPSGNPDKPKRCCPSRDTTPKTIQIVKHFQAAILTDSSRTSTADTTTTNTDPCSTIKSTMCDSQDDEDFLDDDHVMCTTNYEEPASKSLPACCALKRSKPEVKPIANMDSHMPCCVHVVKACPRSECCRHRQKDMGHFCQRCDRKDESGTAPRIQIKLSNIDSTHRIQPHIKNLSCKNMSNLVPCGSQRVVAARSSTQRQLCKNPECLSRTSCHHASKLNTTALESALITNEDEQHRDPKCDGSTCDLKTCSYLKKDLVSHVASNKPHKGEKDSVVRAKGDTCTMKCREHLETALRVTLKAQDKRDKEKDADSKLDASVVSNTYVQKLKEEITSHKADYELTSSGCIDLKDIRAEICRYRRLLKTSNNVIEKLPPGASSDDIRNNISEFLRSCDYQEECCVQPKESAASTKTVSVRCLTPETPSRHSEASVQEQPSTPSQPVLCGPLQGGNYLTEQQLNIKKVEDLVHHAESALQRIRQELEIEQNKRPPASYIQCNACQRFPKQKSTHHSHHHTPQRSRFAKEPELFPKAGEKPCEEQSNAAGSSEAGSKSDELEESTVEPDKADGVEVLYEKGAPETSTSNVKQNESQDDTFSVDTRKDLMSIMSTEEKDDYGYQNLVTSEPIKTMPSNKYANLVSISKTGLDIPQASRSRIFERFDLAKPPYASKIRIVDSVPTKKKRKPKLTLQKLPSINIRGAPLVLQKLVDININPKSAESEHRHQETAPSKNVKYEEMQHQCMDEVSKESCFTCSYKEDLHALQKINSKRILELLNSLSSDEDKTLVYKSYQVINELHSALLSCTKLEQDDVRRITDMIDEDVYKTFVNPAGKNSSRLSVENDEPSVVGAASSPSTHSKPNVVAKKSSAMAPKESTSRRVQKSPPPPKSTSTLAVSCRSEDCAYKPAASCKKTEDAMLSMLSRISNFTCESARTPSQLQFVATEGTQCDIECTELCAGKWVEKPKPIVVKAKVAPREAVVKEPEKPECCRIERDGGAQVDIQVGSEISYIEQVDEGIQISLSYSDDIATKSTQTDFVDSSSEENNCEANCSFESNKRVFIKLPENCHNYNQILTAKSEPIVECICSPIDQKEVKKIERKNDRAVGEDTTTTEDDECCAQDGCPSKDVTVMSVIVEQPTIFPKKTEEEMNLGCHNNPAGDCSPILDLFTKRMFQEVSQDIASVCYDQFEQIRDMKNSCAEIMKKRTTCQLLTSESSTASLSDGEVRCKCSVSSGEIHFCKYSKKVDSLAYKKDPEKMLQNELGNKDMQIKQQKANNDNWVSYYVSEDGKNERL